MFFKPSNLKEEEAREQVDASQSCKDKVFVELPDGRVVRLKNWLCGVRKAANSHEEFLHREACGEGFPVRVLLSSVIFVYKKIDVRDVVHSADLTFSGQHLEWMDEVLLDDGKWQRRHGGD